MKQHFKTRLTVLLMILSIMLLCLGLAACGGTKTYTVTVSETANGTVSLSPEAADNKYDENAKVEVTVTPATGYEVDTFTVSTDADAALTAGKYTLTVTADTTISATFKSTAPTPPPAKTTYTVTVNETTNGTVSLDPAAADNKYEENAEVEVTVTPATGYEVDTFTVSTDADAALTEGKYTLTVTDNTTISATFKSTTPTPPPATKYTVTVSATTNGTVSLSPAAADNKYEENAEVEVTVTPAAGYEVDTFTVSTDGNATLTEGKYTLTVTGNTTISATFKETVVPVTQITLSAQTLQLEVGREDNQTGTLTATVLPDNATTKTVTWSVQPESGIVSISANGNTLTITPETTGAVVITATIGTVSATCTVSVSEHKHQTTGAGSSTEVKDAENHYLICECGYREEASHTKALTYDAENAEAGHYNACAVCGWKEDSATKHTLTPRATTSTVYHLNECTCGYSVEEKHTYNAEGSTSMLDGVTYNDQEHYIECYVCHMHINSGKHTFTYEPLDNGTHKVTCSEMIPGTAVACKYEKTVSCEGAELTYDDDEDANNHYTLCKDCNTKFNAQPHQAQENGKCECGKEMQTHTHTPIADENGYYDGSCSCGENLFFTVDKDNSAKITAYAVPAEYEDIYTKVKIPEKINGVTITELGSNLFSGAKIKNYAVTEVYIPDNVTTLGSAMFGGTSSSPGKIKVVILGKGITGFGATMFSNNSVLEKVVSLSTEFAPSNISPGSSISASAKFYFSITLEAFKAGITAAKLSSTNQGKWGAIYPNCYFRYDAAKPEDDFADYGGAWHMAESGNDGDKVLDKYVVEYTDITKTAAISLDRGYALLPAFRKAKG